MTPYAAVFWQEHVGLKIENAARKLARWNPAEVTLAELQQSVVTNRPFFRSLEGIVRGDPRVNARAKVDGKVRCDVQPFLLVVNQEEFLTFIFPWVFRVTIEVTRFARDNWQM